MALDDNETMTADEQAQMAAMQAADADDGSDGTAAETPTPSAAEPAAEPAADTAESGAASPAAEPAKRMVDYGALHEERERRKELEHRNKVLEERTNLILQRFNQQSATPQPAADAPKAPPPLETDPVGHIVGQQALHGQAIQEVARLLQAQDQQNRRTAEITNIQQQAIALEREYRETVPDYDAAVAHLLASQEKELLIAGFADPVQRQRVLSEQAFGTVARALQTGKNPAETVYELAKARGYTAKPAEATAAPDAADKIKQIANGQQQARSVGQVRGSGGAALTAQRLAEMSDTEFMKILDTPAGKDLMGA